MKTSDIVIEIVNVSRKQPPEIEQVNTAVIRIEEMTQQNAALVEQAAAASETVTDQARDLSAVMAGYRWMIRLLEAERTLLFL